MARNPFGRLNPFSKDRNAKALVHVAEGQFAARVHAGELSLIDLFGRKVKAGDLITWMGPQPIVWEIVNVRPIMDPNAPAGAINVEIRASANIPCLANQMMPQVIVVGHLERPEPVSGPVEPGDVDPRD